MIESTTYISSVYKSQQEAARWFHDDRQYVIGERFGTADILLVLCLDWAVLYEIDLPTPLGDYRDRIVTRPAYQAAWGNNSDSSIAMTEAASS